jgi:hypothetical protein
MSFVPSPYYLLSAIVLREELDCVPSVLCGLCYCHEIPLLVGEFEESLKEA